MIYGYARVSTTGQYLSSQLNNLKEQGYQKIFQEILIGNKQIKSSKFTDNPEWYNKNL